MGLLEKWGDGRGADKGNRPSMGSLKCSTLYIMR